jgi:hypothetical protein
MGIGRQTTPIAFVNSCEVFTQTENLDSKKINTKELIEISSTKPAKKVIKNSKKDQEQTSHSIKIPTKELEKIDKAFDLATSEEDETHIARIGGILRQIDPSFDPRSFGYKNLSQLFENIEKYCVVKNEINGLNHPLVKLK